MEIIRIKDLKPIEIKYDICAAVGNFDGVHLGHKKLIDVCKGQGMKSAILTFYPHPNTFIRELPNYEVLTPIDLKVKILEKENIDYLIIVEFSEEVAKVDKSLFIDFMKAMRIKRVVCGYDFTFGYKAMGTVESLESEFDVIVVKKYVLNDVRVSTTHIKDLLREGKLNIAKLFLGRNHIVIGKVLHGNNIGTNIGFPTANVFYGNALLPKNGVYFVKVSFDNKTYYGMANIGYNPTINYSEEKKLEVHIFDFYDDLYNKELMVEFVSRIRTEKKYDSKEALIEQLNIDKAYCLENIKKSVD